MQAVRYASQLQQLRAVEKERSANLTDQAMMIYSLRVESILASDIPEPLKEKRLAQAWTQYTTFMEREPVIPEAAEEGT